MLTCWLRRKRKLLECLRTSRQASLSCWWPVGGTLTGICLGSSRFSRPKNLKRRDLSPIKKEQAEINIFTVASGLLYEVGLECYANEQLTHCAFVSICVHHVSQCPQEYRPQGQVLFIESLLSPSFLLSPIITGPTNASLTLFIGIHSSHGRRVQRRLRARHLRVAVMAPRAARETMHHPIIWAYKILLLDALFPKDLKKVIFVDADQIVRADLKEPVDLDLQAAPYGYSPMGVDNTAMDGRQDTGKTSFKEGPTIPARHMLLIWSNSARYFYR